MIKWANLPDKKVDLVLISNKADAEILNSLNELNISTVFTDSYKGIDCKISSHPDMQFLHMNGDVCFSLKDFNKVKATKIDKQPGEKYPSDVLLNCVVLKDKLICNKKTVADEVLKYASDKFEIINVKQGYTKCALCVVDEKSLITEDLGLCKALKLYGFDVLLVEDDVCLEGYDKGFIGGASGKTDKDKLCFFGNIKLHKNYEDIKKFCYKKDVEIISLADFKIKDLGSLIPLL